MAVKVLPGKAVGEAHRFAREVQILAALSSPLVVRYVAHGATEDGARWLAMEWLEGEDLARRLTRGPLGVAETLVLGRTLADALAFVHARGVVHRDLKPSNVFLVDGRLERATLIDFGVARLEDASGMTRTGTMLGTPGYMAPEQVHRGGSDVDARADVFSFGTLLFECLAGEPLFSGRSVLAILAKIALEPAPRVRERVPAVPATLDDLLARMLAKEPADRPADGRAVAEALRAVEAAGADAAAPPRQAPTLTGDERRAIALIMAGGGATPVDRPRDDTPPPLDADLDAELRAEAALHGGSCVRFLNGTVAVVLTGSLATDLATQAARCALSLRSRAPGWPIALAVGRAELAGPLPVGPVIDEAARLLGPGRAAAGGLGDGRIRVDEREAGLFEAGFDVRREGEGFVLVAERELWQDDRTLLGKRTPLVGREAELSILEQLFDRSVEEGVAQAALVSAQAGFGKSRLARELLRRVRARRPDVAVLTGRGEPLRAGSAFALLAQALREPCGVRDGEPLAARRERVRAAVAERVGEGDAHPVAEFMGELLGVPFEDAACLPLRAARRDARLMSDHLREAFLRFLSGQLARQPTVIVLEDLHWGDGPTIQLVDRALLELRERPLFVLALARPEIHETFPRLWVERGSHEMRLAPLGRRAIERLVRHVLGAPGAETLDRLARQCEGNAFYLEELIRWAAQPRAEDLPDSLVTMVQSRLSALDEESRWLLRAASVFGDTFWPEALAALGGARRATAVGDRLRRLVEREVLVEHRESRIPGEREFAFRHALLREGAHAMLTDEDRRLGHRLAGAWLEARGEQDARVLAEHFALGGDGPRAAAHYLRAAARASAGSDTSAALGYVGRGLALEVPEELRDRLLGLRCELQMYRLDLASAGTPDAAQLLRAARPGSLPWTQALLITLIHAAHTGAREALGRAIADALAAEFQPEATELALLVLGFGAAFCDYAGDLGTGGELVRRAGALLPPSARETMPAAAVFGDIIGSSRYYAHDDLWSGLVLARRARALAEAIGHRRYALGARMLGIVMSSFLGDYDGALSENAASDLPDHEFGLGSSLRPFALSWLHADLGSLDEARAWAERLVTAGAERHLALDEARGRWALGEVCRRAGALARADAELSAATSALESVCPLDWPGAMASLSLLRLAQARPEEALAAAGAGVRRFEVMGACGLFRSSFLLLAHAESLAAAGRGADAAAALTRAAERVRASAARIGDPAYREGFLTRVPQHKRILALAGAAARGPGCA